MQNAPYLVNWDAMLTCRPVKNKQAVALAYTQEGPHSDHRVW